MIQKNLISQMLKSFYFVAVSKMKMLTMVLLSRGALLHRVVSWQRLNSGRNARGVSYKTHNLKAQKVL